MTKIMYPHRLRAIRVREDMVMITTKNAPGGAWEDMLLCGDEGLLLGNPLLSINLCQKADLYA